MVSLRNLKQNACSGPAPGSGPCPGPGLCVCGLVDDLLYYTSLELAPSQLNQNSLAEASGPGPGPGFSFAAKSVFIFRTAAPGEQNPPEGQRKQPTIEHHDDRFGHFRSPAGLAGCCHANLSAGRSPGPVGSWPP